jgi:hypothetical protein
MKIIYEQTFTSDAGERLRPDLVVVTESIGHIIDDGPVRGRGLDGCGSSR